MNPLSPFSRLNGNPFHFLRSGIAILPSHFHSAYFSSLPFKRKPPTKERNTSTGKPNSGTLVSNCRCVSSSPLHRIRSLSRYPPSASIFRGRDARVPSIHPLPHLFSIHRPVGAAHLARVVPSCPSVSFSSLSIRLDAAGCRPPKWRRDFGGAVSGRGAGREITENIGLFACIPLYGCLAGGAAAAREGRRFSLRLLGKGEKGRPPRGRILFGIRWPGQGGSGEGGGWWWGYSRPKRRKSFEVPPVAMPSMETEVPETVTAASVASRHVPESRSSVT